jgi:fatty-acid desaturase
MLNMKAIFTWVLGFVLGYFAGCGITVGCHRYWAHRTFKAKLPLQIILMIAQTMGAQVIKPNPLLLSV